MLGRKGCLTLCIPTNSSPQNPAALVIPHPSYSGHAPCFGTRLVGQRDIIKMGTN